MFTDSENGNSENVVPRPLNPPPRRAQDRERLYAKIQEDLDKEHKVLEKPRIIGRPELSSSSANPRQVGSPNRNGEGSGVSQGMVGLPSPDGNSNIINQAENVIAQPRTNSTSGGRTVFGGQDSDPETDKKREFIKKVGFLEFNTLFLFLNVDY